MKSFHARVLWSLIASHFPFKFSVIIMLKAVVTECITILYCLLSPRKSWSPDSSRSSATCTELWNDYSYFLLKLCKLFIETEIYLRSNMTMCYGFSWLRLFCLLDKLLGLRLVMKIGTEPHAFHKILYTHRVLSILESLLFAHCRLPMFQVSALSPAIGGPDLNTICAQIPKTIRH